MSLVVYYCLVRRNQRKFSKDVKVIPSKECITQDKALVCIFMIREVKDTKRKFVHRRNIWQLHENSVKSDLRSYINKYRAGIQKDASVKGY